MPESHAPDNPEPEATPDYDAWRDIPVQRWYIEAGAANPHVVRHDGPCGERFLCDVPEHRSDGYARVEMLNSGVGRNPGELVFHCEGEKATLRPGDPAYARRRAGLLRREDVA